jgi:hypothetical protein
MMGIVRSQFFCEVMESVLHLMKIMTSVYEIVSFQIHVLHSARFPKCDHYGRKNGELQNIGCTFMVYELHTRSGYKIMGLV